MLVHHKSEIAMTIQEFVPYLSVTDAGVPLAACLPVLLALDGRWQASCQWGPDAAEAPAPFIPHEFSQNLNYNP